MRGLQIRTFIAILGGALSSVAVGAMMNASLTYLVAASRDTPAVFSPLGEAWLVGAYTFVLALVPVLVFSALVAPALHSHLLRRGRTSLKSYAAVGSAVGGVWCLLCFAAMTVVPSWLLYAVPVGLAGGPVFAAVFWMVRRPDSCPVPGRVRDVPT